MLVCCATRSQLRLTLDAILDYPYHKLSCLPHGVMAGIQSMLLLVCVLQHPCTLLLESTAVILPVASQQETDSSLHICAMCSRLPAVQCGLSLLNPAQQLTFASSSCRAHQACLQICARWQPLQQLPPSLCLTAHGEAPLLPRDVPRRSCSTERPACLLQG